MCVYFRLISAYLCVWMTLLICINVPHCVCVRAVCDGVCTCVRMSTLMWLWLCLHAFRHYQSRSLTPVIWSRKICRTDVFASVGFCAFVTVEGKRTSSLFILSLVSVLFFPILSFCVVCLYDDRTVCLSIPSILHHPQVGSKLTNVLTGLAFLSFSLLEY